MRLIELTVNAISLGWVHGNPCSIASAVSLALWPLPFVPGFLLSGLLSHRKPLFLSGKVAFVLLSLLSSLPSILKNRPAGGEHRGRYARTKGQKGCKNSLYIYKYIYYIYLGKVKFCHSNLGHKSDISRKGV